MTVCSACFQYQVTCVTTNTIFYHHHHLLLYIVVWSACFQYQATCVTHTVVVWSACFQYQATCVYTHSCGLWCLFSVSSYLWLVVLVLTVVLLSPACTIHSVAGNYIEWLCYVQHYRVSAPVHYRVPGVAGSIVVCVTCQVESLFYDWPLKKSGTKSDMCRQESI